MSYTVRVVVWAELWQYKQSGHLILNSCLSLRVVCMQPQHWQHCWVWISLFGKLKVRGRRISVAGDQWQDSHWLPWGWETGAGKEWWAVTVWIGGAAGVKRVMKFMHYWQNTHNDCLGAITQWYVKALVGDDLIYESFVWWIACYVRLAAALTRCS